jgi:cytochrome c-type biogenesis protein CcmH/NrfG
MGWLILLLLGLLVAGGLWLFGRQRGPAFRLVLAALFVAAAGYAWQGRPGLAGSTPAPRTEQERGVAGLTALREAILGRFDRAAVWLNISDSYLRRGDTANAVGAIRSGIRQNPRDADLWIGLGNALVIHSDGVMTPAAEFAFRRAQELNPGNPAAKFFYGLALVQGGRIGDTERLWTEVLQELPADTSWRPLVEERLMLVRELRAMMERQAAAPQPPQ